MTPPQGMSARQRAMELMSGVGSMIANLGDLPVPIVTRSQMIALIQMVIGQAEAAARADERVKFVAVLIAAETLIEFTDGVFDPNDDTKTEYWCPVCGGNEAANSARICNAGCPREKLYDAVTKYNKNQMTEAQPVEQDKP
ncbi:hypothetical protein LCGC14_0451200 [marine sediment metagenome]|uniref:Uncharacterized protein n=1 Tax=marine sediment metagenome TaxID=412755 RepID=A0A0F9SNA2_9ZZZZ